MAWIRTIAEGEAEGPLADLYRRLAEPGTTRVDNILKVHSLHVAGLEAHWAVYRAAMDASPTLGRAEREMIALVVSGINGCHY